MSAVCLSGTLAGMNHDEFESIVDEVIAHLPSEVRHALHNIELLVRDVPDTEVVSEGDSLLGLYTGTPLTERPASHVGDLPDIIYIFRLPHLELGLPPEELRAEIRTTVLHEVAHYFGIDDERLAEIGWG